MHWDWCEETFKDQLQTHMPNKKKTKAHQEAYSWKC